MEDSALVFCHDRSVAYGICSLIIGSISYVLGRHVMQTYDKERDETYKYVSILIFSIGVVMMTYGILSVALRDNLALCALSML